MRGPLVGHKGASGVPRSGMCTMEERAFKAILEACRSLRRRHEVEEGAHAPALTALLASFNSRGAELESKVESLQQEVIQLYRANAQASEQLVQEVQSVAALKAQLAKEEARAGEQEKVAAEAQASLAELTQKLDEATKAVELDEEERQALRKRLEEQEVELKRVLADNKSLVDRWMALKLRESDRMNEANDMYLEMIREQKAGKLEELARQQVDGIVRNSEFGAEKYVEPGASPTKVRHTFANAHDGSCTALLFEHSSSTLFSGGFDRLIKLWDVGAGTAVNTLRGCLGSVLDLSMSTDNKHLLAACSDHKLFLWNLQTGRIRHTLTGHADKVVTVDFSKSSHSRAVSAAYDRTIKAWDLNKGYGITTLMCHSNCNSLCLTMEGNIFCSGHVDGNLRFWDARTGKLANEVVAHNNNGISSVSLSRSGQSLLTTGRDNINNVFDVRTFAVRASFRSPGFQVGTNWSRSCMSPDEKHVVAGSADGTVYLWKDKAAVCDSALKEHKTSVLSCAWSAVGKPLATADKSGVIYVWG